MSMEDLRSLCTAMRAAEAEKEEAEEVVSEINKRLDELRLHKIPEMMDTLGLRTATFEGLGRVQLAADIYASTKSGQKDAAMAWLTDCGYGGMISPSVNASSLKALFRQQIKDGIQIPEEIFNVTPFIRASIVKA